MYDYKKIMLGNHNLILFSLNIHHTLFIKRQKVTKYVPKTIKFQNMHKNVILLFKF